MSYVGALIVATLLGLAAPAGAGVTLHFTFGLTRQADACWSEGDQLKYRLAGVTYEIARAEVWRIDGECGSAPSVATNAVASSPGSPAPHPRPEPTDAMLTAGHVTLAAPSWSPPSRGGCRSRGLEGALRKVIDGDTIEVRLPDGHAEVVRYIGVNAPEVQHPDKGEEPGGRAAKTLNETLLRDKRLELVFDVQDRDRYGRLLAYVYASGDHVNATLVERGYAAAASQPPNVCFRDRFRSLERQAREGRRGLWGEPGHETALAAAGEARPLPRR
jgi:micrococcal nuclease